jgi:hypothetical protein
MTTKSKIAGFLVLLFSFTLIAGHSSAQVNPNAEVEAKVRASFPDMPDMITIASCESGFRQFNADGTPLRGGTGKNYIGIFQISESVHLETAKSMAYDIYSVDGNIAYARHLFFLRGNAPWISCLGSTPVSAAPAPVLVQDPAPPSPIPTPTNSSSSGSITGILTTNLSYGMVMPQVLILQKILNKKGFVISLAGAGSPGNETALFGQLTREAVRKFQCAQLSICSGSETTTGYGRVGPMTRAALNN